MSGDELNEVQDLKTEVDRLRTQVTGLQQQATLGIENMQTKITQLAESYGVLFGNQTQLADALNTDLEPRLEKLEGKQKPVKTKAAKRSPRKPAKKR